MVPGEQAQPGTHPLGVYMLRLKVRHTTRSIVVQARVWHPDIEGFKAAGRAVIRRRQLGQPVFKNRPGYYGSQLVMFQYEWATAWDMMGQTPSDRLPFLDNGGLLPEDNALRALGKVETFLPLKLHEMLENIAGSR